MLQGGSWGDFAYILTKAIIAIVLWGGAAIGYWLAPLSWIERVWAFAAASCLVAALPLTDEIGIGMGIALALWHFVRLRGRQRAERSPAPESPRA
jgi:TRAP-type uncharacterized transport system fused permease subunit